MTPTAVVTTVVKIYNQLICDQNMTNECTKWNAKALTHMLRNTSNIWKYSQEPSSESNSSCCQFVSMELSSTVVKPTLRAVWYKKPKQVRKQIKAFIKRLQPGTWLNFSHDCPSRTIFKFGQNPHFACGHCSQSIKATNILVYMYHQQNITYIR